MNLLKHYVWTAESSTAHQINGNRLTADINAAGGANMEIGGANSDQLVEYVRSYDPR